MTATIVNGRGIRVPAVTLHFASGATRVAARDLVKTNDHTPMRVLGLDADGRIVVNYYPDDEDGGWTFGLTLCCNASNKGIESGVVCRACYGTRPTADEGDYGATAVDAYVRYSEGNPQ
jgi:outer membrane receptor for monomeric catechols